MGAVDESPLRIATYGSGRTITEILRQLPEAGLSVTGAVVHNPARAGTDLGELTLGEPIGVETTADLGAVLDAGVDVLLYGGLIGETHEQVMRECAAAGVDVIHACFVHPRINLADDVLRELETAAQASGARILGTGVMPGMWVDVLPALLVTCAPDPVRITARRISNLSSWGPEVLRQELGLGTVGTGLATRFDEALRESAAIVADALGLESAELSSEGGLVSARDAKTVGDIEVEVGQVEGFDQRVVVRRDGEEVINLAWLAIPDPDAAGLSVGLELSLVGADGQPVSLKAVSPLDPYPATAARMVKAISPLRRLQPGLHLPTALAVA